MPSSGQAGLDVGHQSAMNARMSASELLLEVAGDAVRRTRVDLQRAVLHELGGQSAAPPIGTIWSSSPCAIRIGTSSALRSSVKSVSENALTQS